MAVNIPSSGAVLALLRHIPHSAAFSSVSCPRPQPTSSILPLPSRRLAHELTEPLFASRNSNLPCSRDSSASIESCRARLKTKTFNSTPSPLLPAITLPLLSAIKLPTTPPLKGCHPCYFPRQFVEFIFFFSFFFLEGINKINILKWKEHREWWCMNDTCTIIILVIDIYVIYTFSNIVTLLLLIEHVTLHWYELENSIWVNKRKIRL